MKIYFLIICFLLLPLLSYADSLDTSKNKRFSSCQDDIDNSVYSCKWSFQGPFVCNNQDFTKSITFEKFKELEPNEMFSLKFEKKYGVFNNYLVINKNLKYHTRISTFVTSKIRISFVGFSNTEEETFLSSCMWNDQ